MISTPGAIGQDPLLPKDDRGRQSAPLIIRVGVLLPFQQPTFRALATTSSCCVLEACSCSFASSNIMNVRLLK